jgi:hypothetical protein
MDSEYALFDSSTDKKLSSDDLGITRKQYREIVSMILMSGDGYKVSGRSVYIDFALEC